MKNVIKYTKRSIVAILTLYILIGITGTYVYAVALVDENLTSTNEIMTELVPDMARTCGFNSLNLLSNTKIAGYTVTMDLEHGGAGHNIHIRVNGQKYYYDMENECWPSGVPNKVANSSVVADALAHGYDMIEAGWM